MPSTWPKPNYQVYCHINVSHKALYIYVNRKLDQDHKVYAGYTAQTLLSSSTSEMNIYLFCTYSGTEDQCNVLMISNGSEGNLRQDVVIL